MRLRQNTSTAPIQYSGSGYIRQGEDGIITFKLYARDFENTSYVDALKAMLVNNAGRLYRDEDLFVLEAADYRGMTWTAERILIEVVWPQPTLPPALCVPSVSGKIWVLSTRPRAYPATPIVNLEMRFFDDVEVPATHVTRTETTSGGSKRTRLVRDFAEFKAAQCTFFVRRSEGEIVMDITSKSPFPVHFETRVVEALRYVLARSVSWRVLIRREASAELMQLSSERKISPRTAFQRPLSSDSPDHSISFWTLFGRYLEYVIQTGGNDPWHKCSAHLHNAREASANSLDAAAVALCIAVEGISSLIEWTESENDKTRRKKVCAHIREWLRSKGWEPSTFTQRVNGLVGMLGNPRVQDRLEPLIKCGRVNSEHLKCWKALRHPGAHGNTSGIDGLDEQAVQALLNNVHTVSVLMYHLTFHLIGYEGAYTDYSRTGWPTASYPLTPARG